MMEMFRSLWQDDAGQDLAEYAMLVVLIAAALITVVGAFAVAVGDGFTDAAAGLFGG